MEYTIGDKVHYIPFEGCDKKLIQNGIIKSINSNGMLFVVFHCNNDWDNYSLH